MDKKIDEMKDCLEGLADKINKINVNSVNREINLARKLDDILKRTQESDDALHEGIKMNVLVKDRVEKNSQMLNEIIIIKSDLKGDKENDKIIDEVAIICSEMKVKLDKNYQMIKENINVNKFIKDKKSDKSKETDEILQNF